MLKQASLLAMVFLLTGTAYAESLAWVKEPSLKQEGKAWLITFTLNQPSDVEVAIMNPADGTVVRHLAAGALGGPTPPPAPLISGPDQRIPWDGADDYGQAAPNPTKLVVRVRAGMRVKLKRILGGDPYAYFSKEMGQGDHAAWRITGLEAKADGTVYVLGNANNYGPPALRAYSASGEYLRTVFPPPADKPVDSVKGWGVNVRADGTWTPQYNDLSSPALSKTNICGTRGRIARLIPSPGKDELLLEYDYKLMKVNTDGTVQATPQISDQFINVPALDSNLLLAGPWQIALAPGGSHFYLGGIYAASGGARGRTGAEKIGFWRDGQIFKVETASRKATAFFSLPEADVITDMNARGSSPIADFKYGTYAALQGVAVDAEGHVFVCDRQNKRILILDGSAKIIREIPLEFPDAVAVHPTSKSLYVTTRKGHYHKMGELKLLKFNDWSKNATPSAEVPLCTLGTYDQATLLAIAEAKGVSYLWVAYTSLPVRVFKDKGAELELVKDFYESGPQRALDLQHMIVDPKNDMAYISDSWGSCFRVVDWKTPRFERCMQDEKTPLRALSLALDARGRYLYGHSDRSPVARYKMDGPFFTPAPVGGAENAFTQKITNDWRIGLGLGDRGIAAAPDGSIATLGAHDSTGPDYSGPLNFFKADAAKAPWEPLNFTEFGKARSGGIRFDVKGNLYVGKSNGKAPATPQGFEKDQSYQESTGRIYKYAPTGSMGNLFPTEPAGPAKVYEIPYGSICPQFSRTPRFGVDGWGRIYYPASLLPQVAVIDNEGNSILAFGTYGNRDSLGGLEGDMVPTKDVPMAWPNSVDATDDYIYVSDLVNIRLMQLEKQFGLSAISGK